MAKHNSMYPESVYNRASDIIEKVRINGIKVQKRGNEPAKIDHSLGNGYWLEVNVEQNNNHEWCFFISLSNESERYDDNGELKVIPINSKFKDQSYITGIEKTAKEYIAKVSNHEDPKMFKENVRAKVIKKLKQLIREEISRLGN